MAPEIPADPEAAHLLSPLSLAITATRDMPHPYLYSEHLQLISQELVKLRMRPRGWPKRLALTAPPRHGKSEICSHWFPVWDLALDPRDRIIACTYEAEFAASWGRKARRSMQEHYPILGAKIMEDSRAAHRWETTYGGGMTTAGVGGPITGKGGNILILDDPIKNAEEANSQVIRDNLWDWWQSTFLTRLEPDGIIVVIMTRWNEDDLIGRIKNTPEAKFWRFVDLPAIAEDHDPLGRQPGQALWPERYDELELETKAAEVGPRVWAALFQGRPAPPEGLAIPRGTWQWYDEMPKIEDFQDVVQSWDTTFKAVDSADFVAGGVVGRMDDRIYVLDLEHKRMNGPDTMEAIYAMDKVWPRAKWVLIEDTASGSMICDIMQRERGHIARITPKGQKETRLHWGVNSLAAVCARGGLYLPRGNRIAQMLVNEGANFPHGAHDDLLDMLVQAVARLLPKTWVWQNEENRRLRARAPTNPVELHVDRLQRNIAARMKANTEKADVGRKVKLIDYLPPA